MERSTAARLLILAVVLGVLAEVLLNGLSLGLNLVLFVSAVMVAAWTVRPPGRPIDPADLWLAPAGAVFAGFVALRADGPLILFDSAGAGLESCPLPFARAGCWPYSTRSRGHARNRPPARTSPLGMAPMLACPHSPGPGDPPGRGLMARLRWAIGPSPSTGRDATVR